VSREIIHLELTCTHCDHKGAVDGKALSDRLNEPLTYANIAELSGEFKYSACGSKAILINDDQCELLLDSSNTRLCQACEKPIIFPRLQSLPGTSLCHTCAEEGEQPELTSPYPTPPPELSKCPRCESPSIVRENSETEIYFIGCTSFPKRRWTEELSDDHLRR